MLHVVGAKPAVVGAAVVHFAVEALRHFGFFHKHFAPEAIVFGIVADEHALHAVVGTPFVHINLVVFKHDFCFYLLEAGAAHGGSGVVEMVGAVFARHGVFLLVGLGLFFVLRYGFQAASAGEWTVWGFRLQPLQNLQSVARRRLADILLTNIALLNKPFGNEPSPRHFSFQAASG